MSVSFSAPIVRSQVYSYALDMNMYAHHRLRYPSYCEDGEYEDLDPDAAECLFEQTLMLLNALEASFRNSPASYLEFDHLVEQGVSYGIEMPEGWGVLY